MVSITIVDLVKRFGSTLALDKINLEIHAGELFFLLGPSGCGKTTLLRHIAGFYQPTSGRVLFDGEDVSRVPAHERNTAMMFQSYALWPHMNVAKNVAFGLEERKVSKPEIAERVANALDAVQMGDYGDRKINQLSGGQQQRVALARALVVRPQCLLLDEPLSNLDAKLRLEMRGQIRKIVKDNGLTAIYVTHDRAEALSIADRMAIFEQGVLSQVGSPEDVYRHPLSPSVATFIGESNLIEGTISEPGSSGDGEEAQVTVDTALGNFRGRVSDSSWTPSAGDAVTLSIRPEAISLAEGNYAAAGNQIGGELAESVYLGEIAQYAIDAGDGAGTIRLAELNPRYCRPAGEDVTAVVAPEDVVVLRR